MRLKIIENFLNTEDLDGLCSLDIKPVGPNEIKVYQENKSHYLDIEDNISFFVVQGILNLPIFYSFPLKLYLSINSKLILLLLDK